MPKNILFFRPREQTLIQSSRHPFTDHNHYPGYQIQSQRIPTIFKALQFAVNNRNLQSQVGVDGIDPEFVLVFEVAGSIDSFNLAAKKAGMEWLCCEDGEGDPDEDFYLVDTNGNRTEKSVPQKIYLTMSNSQALSNLMSLWTQYCNAKDHKLPRGLGAFAHLFAQLRNIRKWGKQDRFSDGVENAWREILEGNPDTIKFEVELWYRDSELNRQQSEKKIRDIVVRTHGHIIRIVKYDVIRYHAMIVEMPADSIRLMLDNNDTELLCENQIMWFRATGQSVAIGSDSEIADDIQNETPLPTEEPKVALLDGMPLENHTLLQGRLVVDDPDDFEDNYPVINREHGTSMASLIIYGDLNAPQYSPLKSKLYVRPIMKPRGRLADSRLESIPDDELLVDLIHRAVIGIISNPETSSIKIINLSIGSLDRPFFFQMSPESKMLDYLSDKYNLLFIVSAGNADCGIEANDVTAGHYKAMSLEDRAKVAYKDIWNHRADRKILAPSESINALTIGSLHLDYTNIAEDDIHFNPLPDGFPAVYGRFGGGKNRSAKPDAVVAGGKQYNISYSFGNNPLLLNLSKARINGPGQKIASPDSITSTKHTFGTSNSTALTCRMCALLLENLKGIHSLPSDFESIAAKCLFIHSCSWGAMGTQLQSQYVPQENGKARDNVERWIGYGTPEIERSMFCEDQRVTLFGYGVVNQGNYVEFKFPLPDCLQSRSIEKKLTITLAWTSPIDVVTKKYRLANLEAIPNCADVTLMSSSRAEIDKNMARRGTVQHEVFKGSDASTYIDGTDMIIKVLCKKEQKLLEPIKYVLMATLEVAPETKLPIYDEVAVKVQTPVQVGI